MSIRLTVASVGKSYRTRGGLIAHIDGYVQDDNFPYKASLRQPGSGLQGGSETYTPEGMAWRDGENHNDLVEEVGVIEPTPTPTEYANRIAELKQQLAVANAKISDLEGDKAVLENTNEKIEADRDSLRQQLAPMRDQIEAMREQVTRAQMQSRELAEARRKDNAVHRKAIVALAMAFCTPSIEEER